MIFGFFWLWCCITLFISGGWIKKHKKEFLELIRFQKNGELDITWGNHTYNHRYKPKVALKRNFLLIPNTNIINEIIKVEKLLISYGITPSILFRFPGLVSNKNAILTLKKLGLIPVGSNSWLAKNQKIKNGSIILLHGNKNEPQGIKKAYKTLFKSKYKLGSLLNDLPNSKILKSYEKVYNSTTIDENPLADIKYTLTINTIPSNAKVFITNIIPKYKNGIKLKGATYKIKIKKNGYITKVFQIKLDDNKIYDITLNQLNSKKKEKRKDNSTLTTANRTNYYIQVGSYKGKPSQKFIEIIKNKHFPYIISDGSNGMKRLLIGSFKSKKSAKDALIIVRDLIAKKAFILN